MLGLMQDRPLLISSLIEHANAFHPHAEIVSRTVEGPIHRCTYGDIHRRVEAGGAGAARRSASSPGDRVATLAWNGYRHLELYYGVSGMGAVLHTINPRLFPEQITYIANHAEDSYLFFDLTFAPLIEKLGPLMTTVKGFVAMTDRAHMPALNVPNLLCYEELVGAQGDDYEWPVFDENTASSLCYTSGTTGNPKGVLFSHRSTVLHSYGACVADSLGISAAETLLLVVPMFHVNAWGMPYAGAMSGAKLVMPGAGLDGKSVYELLRDEKVTMALGVPTVWLMLLQHVEAAQPRPEAGAGAAARGDRRIGRAARDEREIRSAIRRVRRPRVGHDGDVAAGHGLQSAWTSIADARSSERLDLQARQGRPIFGVEMKITDDDGRSLPHDGKAYGHLMVRGPWITKGYYSGDGGEILDADGFFDTGDVATIDPMATCRSPTAPRT